LGNLVNRTFTFVHKNFDGKVPSMYSFNEMDNEMLNLLEDYPAKIAALIEDYKFKDATLEIMNLARAGNKYFNDSEPWKSIKNDPERAATSLNICLQTIYTIGELFIPVIPGTSEKIFHMLNARPTEWENCGKINLPEGHQLNPAVLLFTKIEDVKIEEQRNKTANPNAAGDENAEPQNIITIDDFFRTELVVAKVLEAEKVKGSEKLLKLKVSTGKERQIVSGIAKYYQPEEMVGKKVLIVSNLKPAKIMGLESQGMILAVESKEGNLKIVEIDQSIPEGTRAK
ncbi:MAG: methionine--tRNA ligase subunit beta, partial [Ignavibacteriaceae bacterium]|nr:methionine--tRNA ligase subunit beta [Ignavibacteriaceae bacterium]